MRALTTILALIALSACAPTIPPEALQLTAESPKQRQLQTRRFETRDEATLLSASAAVLQDLGFTIDESETAVGLIAGSKDRSAVEAGQVVGAVVLAVLTGVVVPIDRNQKIRVSLVSRPIDTTTTNVRVTFQRIVWNSRNEVTRSEPLDDEKLYQEFFEKLGQSVFLTAHVI